MRSSGMPYTLQLYTVEVVDPPPGWDDKVIDVRHKNIPADQILSLIHISEPTRPY